MYDYIKGNVSYIHNNTITVECNNIGFSIKVPNILNYKIDKSITIFLYLYIKDNLYELYGFDSTEIREMFLNLITVKGIGPKGALSILSNNSLEEIILAICENNISFFKKVPGIGIKSSQQIILDLKNKYNIKKTSNKPSYYDELINILKSLGYTTLEIKNVTTNLDYTKYNDLNSILKKILTKLTNKA